MHLMHDGGGSAGPRTVEVTLAELERVAGPVISRLRDLAAAERARFAGLPLGGGIFGGTPAGRSLAGVHRAAADVYLEVASAIETELTEMQDRLRAVVSTYADTDASAAEVLTRFVAAGEASRAGVPDDVKEAAGRAVDRHVDQLAEYLPTGDAAGTPGPGHEPVAGAAADAAAGEERAEGRADGVRFLP